MARITKITATKTYKTEANAIKAVEKFGYSDEIRYFIMMNDEGRYFPVFLGQAAIQAGVHFNFNVIG